MRSHVKQISASDAIRHRQTIIHIFGEAAGRSSRWRFFSVETKTSENVNLKIHYMIVSNRRSVYLNVSARRFVTLCGLELDPAQ